MANQNFKVKKGLEVGTALTATSDGLNVTGVVTATQFSGDGSGLTGITAAGSGVVVQEEGSNVGTAATINFIGSNVTAAISSGIANVTVSAGGLSNVVEDTTPQLGGNLDLNNKNITGTGSIGITGGFNATGVSTFQDSVTFQSHASFGDNDKAIFGAGNDIQIYHNGTNSFIDNTTGSLYIRGANGNHVRIQSPSGEESIVAAANGSVDLYYDNSKRFETTNAGVSVTGVIQLTSHLYMPDSAEIKLGTGDEFKIYHDGTDSYVDNQTGDLILRTSSVGDDVFVRAMDDVFIQPGNGANGVTVKGGGAVELYHNNLKKFETTGVGVTITGTAFSNQLSVSGISTLGIATANQLYVSGITTFANSFLHIGPNFDNSGDASSSMILGGNDENQGINFTGTNTTDANSTRFYNIRVNKTGSFGYDLEFHSNGYSSGDIGDFIFYKRGTSFQRTERMRLSGETGQLTVTGGGSFAGVVTATSYSGSGSALTGLTGASAGTYGASTNTPIITVDSNGRITGISTVATSGAGGGGGISNILEDTTPQLGGDLDLNGNDITGTGNITITSADAGSSAGPEFKLHRNSASPADADYLGQIKFAGESDTGVERNYAKITGKISDASNGTEDGIIEIAHIKAGSQNISARWKSDELQFLNGTNVSWADNLKATFGASDDLQIYHDGTNSYVSDAGTGGLKITGGDVYIRNTSDQDMIHASSGSFVKLYHNNALRLQTTGTGVNITDDLNVAGISTFNGKTRLLDDVEFHVGTNGSSGDYKFYRDSSNTRNIIYEDISGAEARLISNVGGDGAVAFHFFKGSSALARFSVNTAQLHSGGNVKLETTSTGATVTGALTATTIVKSGGTSSQYLMADGSVSTTVGISTNSNNIQATWSVTANGASAYRFAGPGNDGADDNPDLYLVRGQRYRFTNNSGGSHPFQIRSVVGGSAYSAGVTNNGAASGNIEFNVQHDAPSRLFYQCTAHSGMVGNIYITGGGQWQNTSVAASGTPEIYTDYNVGIGTDNPGEKLHLTTTSGNCKLRIDAASAASVDFYNSGTRFSDMFTDAGTGNFTITNRQNADIILRTNGTNERVYVKSSGEVSIGGFTPTAGAGILQIAGGLRVAGSASASDTTSPYIYRTSGYDHLNIATNGVERLRITSGGYMGLGTANPRRHFHLHNSATATVGFQMTNGGTGESNDSQGFQLKVGSDGHAEIAQMENSNLRIFTNASERLRITSDGKTSLGGSFTPGATLHIRDSNNTTKGAAQLKISKGIGSNAAPTSISRADCYIHLGGSEWGASGTGIYLMGLGYTNGETGSGIPAYIGYRETSSSGYTLGDLVFGTRGNTTGTNNPTERLRITSDGIVDVTGKLRIDISNGGTAGSGSAEGIFLRNTQETDNNAVTIFGGADDYNTAASAINFINVDHSANAGDISFDTRSTGNSYAESLRITSDGEILISNNSNRFLSLDRTNASSGSGEFNVNVETNSQATISYDDGSHIVIGTSSSPRTQAGFSEKVRINSNGHLVIGSGATDNPGDGNTTSGAAIRSNGKYFFSCSNDGGHMNRNNNGYVLHARHSGNNVGGVYVHTSATSFQTGSDYRLKENVVSLDGAITRIKQLTPKRFNFIVEPDTTVDGFIAHEAATVVPEAVTGTYNEVDGDGNPVYQGIDNSKFVPLLTAALQEAIAKIETLEAKVAALEG